MGNRSDNFNRANNAVGPTPGTPSDGGSAWTLAGTGSYGISSNQAYPISPVANDVLWLESSLADGTVSWVVAGGVTYTGYAFRFVDGSNYWRVVDDSLNLNLERVLAGTATGWGSAARAVVGDTISVVLSGSSIIVKKNGSTIITLTDSTHASATKYGLHIAAGSAAVRWDDFSVTASGISVTAGVGALTLTGLAPTVTSAPALSMVTPPRTAIFAGSPRTATFASPLTATLGPSRTTATFDRPRTATFP